MWFFLFCSVNKVTGLRGGRFGILVSVGAGDCFFFETSRPNPGSTQTRMQRVPSFFPVVKQVGCKINHLHPSSAEVENERSCTSVFHVFLYGMDRERGLG